MPTSFQVFYLGNLQLIDTVEGNQSVSTAAVNNWLGTYGTVADPLLNDIRDWAPDSFSGGISNAYDLDNNTSNDTFTVDGVQQTHDALMIFDATITYADGTTATITAAVSQATNGDAYLMPEVGNNADQAALEAGPIRSITLNAPIYSGGVNGRGYSSFANRADTDFVVCFTPGTRIATQRGEVPVQQLKQGDRVFTRDNGVQELAWAGRRNLRPEELSAHPEFQPVMIRAGSLGNDLPQRDMMVSPNHRMLITSERSEVMFGEREVLVAAKHLTEIDGVDFMDVGKISYLHLMFERHEVILADGTWTESFQPGDHSLRGIQNDQREEILSLFPELEGVEGLRNYSAARRLLRAHEAHLLALKDSIR